MQFDLNTDTGSAVPVQAAPDWPYTFPVRAPVREETVLRGSTSAGNVISLTGSLDEQEGRPIPSQPSENN